MRKMVARVGVAAALVAGAIAGAPATASATTTAASCDGVQFRSPQSWSPCYGPGSHPHPQRMLLAAVQVSRGRTAWVWYDGSRKSHKFSAGYHRLSTSDELSGVKVQ